ncbi:MAG: hypothetical protein H6Q35_1054 [Proteobacteria bacterium]|nr:hypothetical protein [Pseudomonadota bacterium]
MSQRTTMSIYIIQHKSYCGRDGVIKNRSELGGNYMKELVQNFEVLYFNLDNDYAA